MKRHAPAAGRNAAPIAEVLAEEFPSSGLVFEVASGTGEHALFLARRFPALEWQPSDADAAALSSIAAWRDEAGLRNLRAPLRFDAAGDAPPIATAAAMLCINMAHISPWEATLGLFRTAKALLAVGAPLALYGPFIEADIETAPSNVAFDLDLKARDARWGLRDTGEIDAVAENAGFRRTARHAMPANNLTLIYRRQKETPAG